MKCPPKVLCLTFGGHFIMNLSAGIGKIRIARKQKFVVSGFGRTGVG